jgi:hypothetical protein
MSLRRHPIRTDIIHQEVILRAPLGDRVYRADLHRMIPLRDSIQCSTEHIIPSLRGTTRTWQLNRAPTQSRVAHVQICEQVIVDVKPRCDVVISGCSAGCRIRLPSVVERQLLTAIVRVVEGLLEAERAVAGVTIVALGMAVLLVLLVLLGLSSQQSVASPQPNAREQHMIPVISR